MLSNILLFITMFTLVVILYVENKRITRLEEDIQSLKHIIIPLGLEYIKKNHKKFDKEGIKIYEIGKDKLTKKEKEVLNDLLK